MILLWPVCDRCHRPRTSHHAIDRSIAHNDYIRISMWIHNRFKVFIHSQLCTQQSCCCYMVRCKGIGGPALAVWWLRIADLLSYQLNLFTQTNSKQLNKIRDPLLWDPQSTSRDLVFVYLSMVQPPATTTEWAYLQQLGNRTAKWGYFVVVIIIYPNDPY